MFISGVEVYDFPDKETGKRVAGCTITCLTEINSKRGRGYSFEGKYSLKEEDYKDVLPCAPIELSWKDWYVVIEKGKIQKIFPIGSEKK